MHVSMAIKLTAFLNIPGLAEVFMELAAVSGVQVTFSHKILSTCGSACIINDLEVMRDLHTRVVRIVWPVRIIVGPSLRAGACIGIQQDLEAAGAIGN